MQTFLPFPDFTKSAQCLDRLRLGKQRVEALQILNALTGKSAGWINHPATKMWRGYEQLLCGYCGAMILEWTKRGYKDTCWKKLLNIWNELVDTDRLSLTATSCSNEEFRYPPWCERPTWLGNEDFHKSHQSNLLRKDFAHYSQFFPGVEATLPYIWPSNT